MQYVVEANQTVVGSCRKSMLPMRCMMGTKRLKYDEVDRATALPPYEVIDNKFALESANKIFNMMASHAIYINKQDVQYQNNKKCKSYLLYRMQS